MDFSLLPYRPDLKKNWDEVVLRSKNANFLHLRDYMDYHAHRFNEQSVMVVCKGKPVAVFPCNLQDNVVISHGGLTYGGLIYGTELHATAVLEIFEKLREYCRELGAKILRYKAIPHIFHRYPAEEDLYALFRLNANLVRRDLSSAIPMWARIKLSDSRKNTIRKAQKNGVTVCEDDHLKDFHGLLEFVVKKFGASPVHTLDELELLKKRFPEKIRLFVANSKGQLLAGALVYDFGHVAHTQYLASSDAGRELGALDGLLAHLLENIFHERRYFSFGISTENGGRHLNEGLNFQKEGFGARAIVHDFYDLEIK